MAGCWRTRGQACFILLCASFSLSCLYLLSINTPQSAKWLLNDTYSLSKNTRDNTTDIPATLGNEESEMIAMELERRRSRIQEVCQTNSTTKLRAAIPLILRKLYMDKKHMLTWCPIYKAASSTWLEIFASLGGVLTTEAKYQIKTGKLQINNLARKAFPIINNVQMAAQHILSSVRILIVRHPFERLLSAYRDKLEHRARREFYYKRYGRRIVKYYNASSEQVEPTFEQFLHFIVDTHVFDEHWRPYNIECAPCIMDYHFILKTESLYHEQNYLTNKLHLKELAPSQTMFNTNINPSGRTDSKTAHQYFASLPQKLLHEVYYIYANDFKLFDYSPQEYFDVARQ